MAKRTYRVTFKGTELTRQTNRTYTHVVVREFGTDGKIVACSWCGRPDLAEKTMRAYGPEGVEVEFYGETKVRHYLVALEQPEC